MNCTHSAAECWAERTEVSVAIRNELAVELAAREGARAASVSASPQSAASAAAVDLPIAVRTDVTATTVTVTVTYVDPTRVPIIGQFIGPSTHQATATMALEP